jgi:hypothetical protein
METRLDGSISLIALGPALRLPTVPEPALDEIVADVRESVRRDLGEFESSMQIVEAGERMLDGCCEPFAAGYLPGSTERRKFDDAIGGMRAALGRFKIEETGRQILREFRTKTGRFSPKNGVSKQATQNPKSIYGPC